MADGARSSALISRKWVDWARAPNRPALTTRNAGELRVVDLFSGCGGMTLGLWEASRRLGIEFNIRLAVDCFPAAIEVYRANFAAGPDVARIADVLSLFDEKIGRLRSVAEAALVEQVQCVDVLVAGPPCQGHSDLNNHSRRNDPRNELYLRAIRAVEVLQPKLAIVENVPSVIHDENGVVCSATNYLASMGYRSAQQVVDISQFGVPQRRRRHLTIASPNLSEGELQELFATPEISTPTVRDFIEDLAEEATVDAEAFRRLGRISPDNERRIAWLFANNAFDLPDAYRPSCHRDRSHSYRSMYGRMHWDRPAQTITTGFGSMGQGRYVHPSRPRTITCHEAARLQGFPDFFGFDMCSSITQLREMIGNAVPPPLISTIVENAFSAQFR